MGSLAPALNEKARAELGETLWQKHKEIVSGFWDSIAQFFRSIVVSGFKIYQDGLVADGDEGLRIVREGISQGSKNYEIIGDVLKRGAVLMKTEELALVRQEYGYIAQLARSKSPREKESAALRYKLDQARLLKQRDDFIARMINETLNAEETGVLFIGAYHDVLSRLPHSIEVVEVKDVGKVREYHKTLATSKRFSPHLNQLALYLTSPIYRT